MSLQVKYYYNIHTNTSKSYQPFLHLSHHMYRYIQYISEKMISTMCWCILMGLVLSLINHFSSFNQCSLQPLTLCPQPLNDVCHGSNVSVSGDHLAVVISLSKMF